MTLTVSHRVTAHQPSISARTSSIFRTDSASRSAGMRGHETWKLRHAGCSPLVGCQRKLRTPRVRGARYALSAKAARQASSFGSGMSS